MINLDFNGAVEDFQTKGYYFKPQMHICKYFLIEVKPQDAHCVVVVYKIGIPQGHIEETQLKNGDEIATHETEQILEIDLWGKYYFPKFTADQYQWYYNQSYQNGKWEFDKDGNMDEVLAIAEVMMFAMELGLKIGKIELY